MNNSVEMEIVRLVKEIAEDEKKLVAAQAQADSYSSGGLKQKYTKESERYKESLERKMNLLRILKG
jgi:hypothetical protein